MNSTERLLITEYIYLLISRVVFRTEKIITSPFLPCKYVVKIALEYETQTVMGFLPPITSTVFLIDKSFLKR
jgi:hypothetical protein